LTFRQKNLDLPRRLRIIAAEGGQGVVAGEGRPTKFTAERRKKFLAKLSLAYTVRTASLAAGISFTTAYDIRRVDPVFAAEWDAAIREGTDFLEDIARKRAAKQSDVLTMFLLKSRNRERFSDRIGIDFSRATPEQVAAAFRQIPLEKLDGNSG